MDALALSLIIGTAFVLSGMRLKGTARWSLSALGLILFILTLNRFCTESPNICSLNWLSRGQIQPPPTPAPTFAPPAPAPSYAPTPIPSPTPTYYPRPVPSPTPTYYPNPVPSPRPTYSPAPAPAPPYSPIPPQTNPQPSPDLSACTDGNCTCVDYKCLW